MEGWSVKQDYDYACGGTNPGTDDEIIFSGPFTDLHSGDYDQGLYGKWWSYRRWL